MFQSQKCPTNPLLVTSIEIGSRCRMHLGQKRLPLHRPDALRPRLAFLWKHWGTVPGPRVHHSSGGDMCRKKMKTCEFEHEVSKVSIICFYGFSSTVFLWQFWDHVGCAQKCSETSAEDFNFSISTCPAISGKQPGCVLRTLLHILESKPPA